MDVLEYWRSEKRKAVEEAEAIVNAAGAENRQLADEEREKVESLTAKAHDLAEKIRVENDNRTLAENVRRLGDTLSVSPERVDEAVARTWGDAFVASEGYQAARSIGFGGRFNIPPVDFRAAVGDPLLESTGNNADALPETFLRQLEIPGLKRERLTLASLFTTVQVTDGNTARYPIVASRTDASGGAVAEGAAKPYAEYTFDDVSVELVKRAAFIAISDEMMTDAPYVASFINSDLPVMVQANEEVAFAAALYTAVTATAAATDITGGSTLWDAVLAGLTDVRTAFFDEPDALFIHPLDWAALCAEKAVAGDGGYFSGGPNATPSTNVWGSPIRVVISQNATQGTPIVGAFRMGGKVFRKGGVSLSASNSHEDFFQLNLVAIRAELRSALGIVYPEAFTEVTLGS